MQEAITILLVLMFGYILFDALKSGKVLMRTGHAFSKQHSPKTYWFTVTLVWVFFGVSALALIGDITSYYRIEREKTLVAKYEQTFPVLVADNVRSYVDKDWCKYINYGGHEVYFVDQPYSACSTTSGKAGGYSQADVAEFQKLEKLFDNQVAQMGIVRDAAGKVTSASFSPNNCFWCDTSYYYSASGTPTATDLGAGFNLGEQVNAHWYTVIEDWP